MLDGEEKEKEKDEGREYKKMNRKQARKKGGDKTYTSTTGIGGKMADKKEYKPHLY